MIKMYMVLCFCGGVLISTVSGDGLLPSCLRIIGGVMLIIGGALAQREGSEA